MITFEPWPKMARLSRDIIVTEKIDGTNAQVVIEPVQELVEHGNILAYRRDDGGDQWLAIGAGSRTRLLSLSSDNYGFAKWVYDNADELVKLGPGRHFGEWWGRGIQRNYGLTERRFSLFNTKWTKAYEAQQQGHENNFPKCCSVVPILYQGQWTWTEDQDNFAPEMQMNALQATGSRAAPGFMNPEGIVVFHSAARVAFKKTFEKDETGKGE